MKSVTKLLVATLCVVIASLLFLYSADAPLKVGSIPPTATRGEPSEEQLRDKSGHLKTEQPSQIAIGGTGSNLKIEDGSTVITRAPATTMTVTERQQAQLESELSIVDRAVKGSATIQAPESTRRGEAVTVTLLVQPGELEPLLAATREEVVKAEAAAQQRGIAARTKVEVFPSKVIILMPTMSASLEGIGFTVLPAGEKQQSISLGAPTRWTWQVSSNETGLRILSVRLSGKVRVGDNDIPRDFYSYTHDIEVSVGPLGFIKQYWQWITSTLLLPLIAWLWAYFRGRKIASPAVHKLNLAARIKRRKSGDA